MRLRIGPQEKDQEVRVKEILFLIGTLGVLANLLLMKSTGREFWWQLQYEYEPEAILNVELALKYD